MAKISAKKFLLWEKKQLLKGGDKNSFSLLIDLLGGLSKKELNFLKIKSEKNIELKIKLETLEYFWDKHLSSLIPIQYLSGVSYWRDLKLEVSNKVLIPRPETELIIEIIAERYKNKKDISIKIKFDSISKHKKATISM